MTYGLVQCWGEEICEVLYNPGWVIFNNAHYGVSGGRAASALCGLGGLFPLVGALEFCTGFTSRR